MAAQLSPAMRRVLQGMLEREAAGDHEGAEIVCDGNQCWRGSHQTNKKLVNRLLRLMLISESSWGGGTSVYLLNSVGRAALRNPGLLPALEEAISKGAPFTVTDAGDLAPIQ